MFGFFKKAAKSVVSAAKVVAKVAKPVATGVAIVYPPAAPIAAGVFVADKALNAVNVPKPGSNAFAGLVAKIRAQQAQKTGGAPPPRASVERAVAKKLEVRRAAGQRVIANTAALAAQGSADAARAMTLIAQRAAARREAARWKVRGGRVARVR